MAKCKEPSAPKDESQSFIEQVAADIERDYGVGVLVDGESLFANEPVCVSWSPSFDIINSGPIEEGSWIGIMGPKKTGKSVSAFSLAAQAQQPERGSRPVYYIKAEGRLSTKHLRGIKGLDLSPGKFNVVTSTEDKILSSKDFLDITTKIIRSVKGAFIIIDSISALCGEKEQTEGVGTETRGGDAKLFSQFCRINNQVVPINKTIVVGITHMIANTSGWGASMVEKGANAWGYQKDYELKVVKKTPWKVNDKQIGLIVEWLCSTSKNGPPGMKLESYIRFGVGIDSLYELVVMGQNCGLIKKAGAWMALTFLGFEEHKHLLESDKVPQFQGGEKVYQALQTKPEWVEALKTEVLKLATDLAGSGGE